MDYVSSRSYPSPQPRSSDTRQIWPTARGKRTSPGAFAASTPRCVHTMARCAAIRIPPTAQPCSFCCNRGLLTREHGSSGRSSHKSRGEAGELEGYNAQRGTQYAHSPSTGQNFLLDRSTAWNDNGTQGAGYYRSVDNSYEKLAVGRSD